MKVITSIFDVEITKIPGFYMEKYVACYPFTSITKRPLLWTQANSVDPDQMSQNAVSHQSALLNKIWLNISYPSTFQFLAIYIIDPIGKLSSRYIQYIRKVNHHMTNLTVFKQNSSRGNYLCSS